LISETAVARKSTLAFLKTEAGSGAALGLAALAALIVANSPCCGWKRRSRTGSRKA
jgi:Na+/H+ antiporter NhaA